MTQKNNLEVPQLQEGRKVETEEWDNNMFLRQEWVPCDKSNCKETQDLHGPYWYSYRNVDGCWKQTYHGSDRPVFGPPRTIEEVQSLIDSLTSLEALSNEQLGELRTAIADIYNNKPESVVEPLGRQAAELIIREKRRRKTQRLKRYDELVDRVLTGESLSEGERDEMQKIAGLLERDL